MTIKDLLEYIEENIADGTLTEESVVNIADADGPIEANCLTNDCNELTICVID